MPECKESSSPGELTAGGAVGLTVTAAGSNGMGGTATTESAMRPAEHVPALRRHVRFLVGDSPHVEDIVQETMVRALDSMDRYDPERPMGPWLHGIAIRVTHKYWRRIRRARNAERRLLELPVRSAPSPEEEMAVHERADLLYRALDTLSPRLREALVLHVGERLPAEEVARLTGSSVSAVYTRVCRARETVRLFVESASRRTSVRLEVPK